MLTPITLRGSSPTSRTGPTTCGSGSAKNASAPPPSAAADRQASGPWPSLLLPVGERGAHCRVPPSPLGRVVRNSLYPRTNAASWLFPSGGASPRSDPGSAPTISRHAARPRSRLTTAGFHSRRPADCACFHFFPRSVGFGPTASRANGALTIAPSMLCQAQAMPSISAYSANPFRHSRTKTPCRFHSKKYLWTGLALPYSFGRAFHWQPVRNTYTIPANTFCGSIGLRPPPGRRLYFRTFSRSRFGITGATFSHHASDTSHDFSFPISSILLLPPALSTFYGPDSRGN